MYLHQAYWSPSKSTWILAIKRNAFTTWPGLTAALVDKYLPKSESTVKGHLIKTFKYVRPTGTRHVKLSQENNIDNDVAEFTKLDDNSRAPDVFLLVKDMNGKIYTGQTGRFPVTWSKGNRYVMIVYDYISNTIHAKCMKSRCEHELEHAYQKIHDILKACGLKPKMNFPDNECA